MIRGIIVILVLAQAVWASAADHGVEGLMERLSPGLSSKIEVEIVPDTCRWVELSQHGDRPLIRANDNVSAAVGLNHYLKHYMGVHVSWNNLCPAFPDVKQLPAVTETVRLATRQPLCYYLNYCTHSYSMAFWDWERWQQEIDWMALHGINMPLAATGMEAVWHNVLIRLGYDEADAKRFIAGPPFQAWWLMNNLEGWGGPVSDEYIDAQASLQKKIVERMRSLDIEPVLPGYGGMLPHDAAERMGVDAVDAGEWCGFQRPSFLLPTDSAFNRVADIYYRELTSLYGPARYYSIDPFHEGGVSEGVDMGAAAEAIVAAMRRTSDKAVWVAQGWQGNPRGEILERVKPGQLMVLDLHAESTPQWRDREGFGGHDWAWCMLLNFGGNVGLHGKMRHVASEWTAANQSSNPPTAIGATMEGIDNNPVMYELLYDLPWHDLDTPDKVDRWLSDYVTARYGGEYSEWADSAWRVLAASVYACPAENRQQGTNESIFCVRPCEHPRTASAWAYSEPYYQPKALGLADDLMRRAASTLGENPNFRFDYLDIHRQLLAEQARMLMADIEKAASEGDLEEYKQLSKMFLVILDGQDSLTGMMPQMSLDQWLDGARKAATSPEESEQFARNALTLLTTWGPRRASEQGRLHDYAHREWQGLLSGFYRERWKRWFDERIARWPEVPEIDFYDVEQQLIDGLLREQLRP